jgi:hypothetical protein
MQQATPNDYQNVGTVVLLVISLLQAQRKDKYNMKAVQCLIQQAMSEFVLARPWWVNLAILVPVLTYYFLRKSKPALGSVELLISAIFGVAFAFVEASVVIYLRAITGLLLSSKSSEVASLSSKSYQEAQIVSDFPTGLLRVELLREAATILILGCVASLTVRGLRERCAIFLWVFGVWDICYYLSLRIVVGWPSSLTTTDVLFLIPTPWVSQVWFPLLVSTVTLLVIISVNANPVDNKRTVTSSI